MRKRFCLLPVLALALLCACSSGEKKTPPTRPADFVSSERQFTNQTSFLPVLPYHYRLFL